MMSEETLPQFVDAARFTPVFTTRWLTGQKELPYTRRQVDRGEHIFMAQERHRFMYHIESGLVRLYLTSSEGVRKTLFYHAAGTQFGFQGFRTSGLTETSAEAMAPCVLYAINYDDLLAFCDEHTQFYLSFIEYLFQIMTSQTKEIANLSFYTGLRRLATLLDSLASASAEPGQRDSGMAGEAPDAVVIPYTIDELAEIIGAHRNTVSNSLARLRKLGYVSNSPRQIVVSDPMGLKRYVEAERGAVAGPRDRPA